MFLVCQVMLTVIAQWPRIDRLELRGLGPQAGSAPGSAPARLESVESLLGGEWEIPPPPALLEPCAFGSEVTVAGMDPKSKTQWCREFTHKAKQATKEVVSKKIRLPTCVRVHGAPEESPIILCYISYYEAGRKTQMKCLELDVEPKWRWVTFKALRVFKTVGFDEVPEFVYKWMGDWEGSTTKRYGRGLKKEEVQGSSSEEESTPVAQGKKRKTTASPSGTKKSKVAKATKPQTASEGLMLSSESVELVASAVANQISEVMGQGILDSIQGAIVGQSASAVAGALKNARKSEQETRIATLEGKLKSSEDKVTKLTDLLTAERASHEKAIFDKDELQAMYTRSESERTRYNTERDSLRAQVDTLEVGKSSLQANLTSALSGGGGQSLSPRSPSVSSVAVLVPPDPQSTPMNKAVQRRWPSSLHPPMQPPFAD